MRKIVHFNFKIKLFIFRLSVWDLNSTWMTVKAFGFVIWQFFCGFLKIRQIEEMAKEHEIRAIHEKRKENVFICNRTRLAVLFNIVDFDIDINSDAHLWYLCRCYEYTYRLGYAETQSPKCIIRIHECMHCEIHECKPATTCTDRFTLNWSLFLHFEIYDSSVNAS